MIETLADLGAPISEGDGFVAPFPARTFAGALASLPLERLLETAHGASGPLVDRALARHPLQRSLHDAAALLSPAAGDRLEDLAAASRALTLGRFGRTMRLYAPLYLSNECLTTCTYCGFARTLDVRRATLDRATALEEARHLLRQGFRSILLLTGEHERNTGVAFLEAHLRRLAPEIPSLALEVQVWSEAEYRRLREAGAEGVVIYQETYDPARYREVHVAGRKRDYRWRLLGPERAACGGMRRVGIGALLGLHDDWRSEAIVTIAHARFLQRTYWRSQVTVSMPRIRPSASGFAPWAEVTDRDLAQYVCAARLAAPDAGIVLSTREPADLRDGLHRIGVTHTSAGSHTEPGGYEHPGEAEEQFEISDHRPPAEVADALRADGYDVVWEDPSTPDGIERGLAVS